MSAVAILVFLLLAAGAVGFLLWVAYDTGYDRGWDAGSSPRPHVCVWTWSGSTTGWSDEPPIGTYCQGCGRSYPHSDAESPSAGAGVEG